MATGNHELYMKRRREQSIEIQQMRYFEEQQQKVRRRMCNSENLEYDKINVI